MRIWVLNVVDAVKDPDQNTGFVEVQDEAPSVAECANRRGRQVA